MEEVDTLYGSIFIFTIGLILNCIPFIVIGIIYSVGLVCYYTNIGE